MILLIGKCHRHISIFTYSLGFISLFHGSNGVLAAPQGGQVLSGEVGISQASVGGQPVTTITQSSNKATLSWQSFNIANGETVRFVQPSASSVAVNRISDPNGSKILGKLSANGQVWLINPAGVYFGPGAQINVGGLIASSVNIPDHTDPFKLLGPLPFSNSASSVTNEGQITTTPGGYAALLGAHVSSMGSISAPGGRILLLGEKNNGSVYLNGRLDTYSLVNNAAGFIETSAARVQIDEAARVSTRNADGSSGTWLIDPTDFTISSGSGSSTTSSIGASTLSTSLDSSSVSIATDNTSGSDSGHIYQPGILSGDNGQWVRMELTRQWTLEQLGPIPPSQLATSLFLESAWLEVYRRPWSSVTDNQAKLSAAGVSLSWTGPHHWTASLSLGRALGKTPSLLSGSSSLHTSAWLELVKKFN